MVCFLCNELANNLRCIPASCILSTGVGTGWMDILPMTDWGCVGQLHNCSLVSQDSNVSLMCLTTSYFNSNTHADAQADARTSVNSVY